jgi:hypothetical protein
MHSLLAVPTPGPTRGYRVARKISYWRTVGAVISNGDRFDFADQVRLAEITAQRFAEVPGRPVVPLRGVGAEQAIVACNGYRRPQPLIRKTTQT